MAQTLTICRSIGVALAYAHDAGLVHRDLKPANILLDRKRVPFIADFGLAKSSDSGERDGLVGTPAYMAPEQGDPEFAKIDCRADIYSFGLILFELICHARHGARTAFDEAAVKQLLKAGANRHIVAVCQKALQIRPQDRYASAQQVVDDLSSCINGTLPVHAKRLSICERITYCSRRTFVRHGSAAAAAVAVSTAGIAAFSYFARSEKTGLARRVSIDTEPGAAISVFGLSPNNGDPLLRRPLASGFGSVTTKLPPGDYLVSVTFKKDEVVEVFRRVPFIGERSSVAIKHLQWKTLAGDLLQLPKVSNRPFDAGLCATANGYYFRNQIIATTEFHRYKDLNSARCKVDDAGNVLAPYDVAVAFAESIGMRLPSDREWRHLRELGMTVSPIQEWTLTSTANLDEETAPGQYPRQESFFVHSERDRPAVQARMGSLAAIRCIRSRA